MKNDRPLVGAAFSCEKVLMEKDGVTSAIRIVDTYTVEAIAIGNQQQVRIPDALNIHVSALVMLKSGDFFGEGELSLVIQTPDGTRKDFPEKWKLNFAGGEHGNNLILNFGISAKHIGVTWIEVLWNSESLTKIPVKLVHAQKQPEAN